MGTPILTIVFAGLVGGILWNLATWLLGLPAWWSRKVTRRCLFLLS